MAGWTQSAPRASQEASADKIASFTSSFPAMINKTDQPQEATNKEHSVYVEPKKLSQPEPNQTNSRLKLRLLYYSG